MLANSPTRNQLASQGGRRALRTPWPCGTRHRHIGRLTLSSCSPRALALWLSSCTPHSLHHQSQLVSVPLKPRRTKPP